MRCILVLMCVACVLLQGVAAYAAPLAFVASGGKVATWSPNWVPGQAYYLSGPVDLKAKDGTLLGKLNSFSITQGADPFVTLNFGVQAAAGGSSFFFDTLDMPFAAIDPAMAFASVGATLTTDNDGGSLIGNFAGGKAYKATYNGGTVFADLAHSFAAGADTTVAETDRNPALGFAPIVGPVSSIRAQWSFFLTDGEGASGSSRFQVEPVPDASTLALAFTGAAPLLAGFALRRRRSA